MVDAFKSLVYEDGTEELEKSKLIVTSMDPRRNSDYLHLDWNKKSNVGCYKLGNDKISSTIEARY